MGRISRGWQLMKMSLGVIRKDKEILVFPLLSIFFSGLLFAGLIFGPFFTGGIESLFCWIASPLFWISLFIVYLAICILIVYFNVAMIGCAMIRFRGGNPVVRDGFKTANQNIRAIFKWAMISATVGVILAEIGKKVKILGKMAEIGWGLTTFFVVPILIYEKVSISQALKRSVDILKETWGEMIVGGLGIGLIAVFLWWLPTVAVAVVWQAIGRPFGLIVPISIVLIWGLVIACVYIAVGSAFRAAMYVYATTKKAPSGFSHESISNPWGM